MTDAVHTEDSNTDEDGADTHSALSLSDAEIKLCVQLFSLKVFLCLIEKKQLDAVESSLRSHAAYAIKELIASTGISMLSVKDEVFCFTNEKTFVTGCNLLTSKVAKLKSAQLTNVGVPPIMFLEMLAEAKPRLLHVDLGSDREMRYGRNKILDFIRVGSLLRIADFSDLYVAEDQKGFAVSMELDGEQFALAFCEEDDAKEILKENKQSMKLAFNTTTTVLKSVIESSFAGLILNPGAKAQTILTKQDMQIAYDLIQLRKGPSLFSKEGLRSLFSLRRS